MIPAFLSPRTIRSAAVVLLTTAFLACCGGAQMMPDPQPVSPVTPGGPGRGPVAPPFGSPSAADPAQARMFRQMMLQRNTLRQKQIVDDTNRLLELAKQLKEAVDKSNKNELSVSVVTTAAQIEKLARAVKEKMRDAQ